MRECSPAFAALNGKLAASSAVPAAFAANASVALSRAFEADTEGPLTVARDEDLTGLPRTFAVAAARSALSFGAALRTGTFLVDARDLRVAIDHRM